MSLPQAVIDAVRAARAAHPADMTKSIKRLQQSLRALPGFKGPIREQLVDYAAQKLVYDDRHADNVQIKRETNGYYGGPAKVGAHSEGTQRAYLSAYEYCVAGKILGDIHGKELPDLVKQENVIASGHVFNARLFEQLASIVPLEKTVREAVSEAKLRKIFEKLRGGDADAA